MARSYADDPILLEMFRYWDRKRGGRAMPARRDLDPTEIPKLLPHLRITEIIEGGRRFRYRLVGTAIVEAFGSDFTGKYVDELYSPERAAAIESNYRRVCAEKRPIFRRSRYITLKGYDIIANRLLAPLSENGREVDIVIAALTFEFGSALERRIDPGAAADPAADHLEIL
ncbi:MAG TPA: PAS domain-containing protein [Stellaceae bacterium]|nr:PAS domain-containing protein [Stellaceae bacterium]